jgi:hypothetical protein
MTGFLRDCTKFEVHFAKFPEDLVESMPSRLEDIIRMEGNNTKY